MIFHDGGKGPVEPTEAFDLEHVESVDEQNLWFDVGAVSSFHIDVDFRDVE